MSQQALSSTGTNGGSYAFLRNFSTWGPKRGSTFYVHLLSGNQLPNILATDAAVDFLLAALPIAFIIGLSW